jgi:hypothetical protein
MEVLYQLSYVGGRLATYRCRAEVVWKCGGPVGVALDLRRTEDGALTSWCTRSIGVIITFVIGHGRPAGERTPVSIPAGKRQHGSSLPHHVCRRRASASPVAWHRHGMDPEPVPR